MELIRHRAQTLYGELVLQIRRGPPPSAALILEGVFLMDSESGVSERALAERGLAALSTGDRQPNGAPLRVLLGGLGLGITLRALLDDPRVGHVVVVELFDQLVRWNREYVGFLNGRGLEDPRVVVHVGDLLCFLEQRPNQDWVGQTPTGGSAARTELPASFDLLLLDIDNGPTMLSLPANDRLYADTGLALLQRWTAPGGIVLIWATERATRFEQCLERQAGLHWSQETIRWRPARGGRELSDVLYQIRFQMG